MNGGRSGQWSYQMKPSRVQGISKKELEGSSPTSQFY